MGTRSILFFLITISSCFSYAQSTSSEFDKILRCQTPLGSELGQGSTVRMDIYYSPTSEKSYMISRPDEGPLLNLFHTSESTKSNVSIENSSMFFEWELNDQEKPYASIVYVGHWVLAMSVSPTMKERDKSLSQHDEVTLFCDETEKFVEFFLK